MKQKNRPQNTCLKCGACCRKNGPVLHLQDLELIRKNILTSGNLVLLRKGEPAMDNIADKPVLLEKELIKIRGKSPASWACVFHDSATMLCLIHNDRPMQCKTLECWEPGKITALYSRDTLTRKEVLVSGSAMAEITAMHEEKCPVEQFAGLIRMEIMSPGRAGREINEMIAFDREFRKNFQEKTRISSQGLDYYFGRPLGDLMTPIAKYIKNTENMIF